jgi:hypothetical protein
MEIWKKLIIKITQKHKTQNNFLIFSVLFIIYVCEIANIDDFPHFTGSHWRWFTLTNVED